MRRTLILHREDLVPGEILNKTEDVFAVQFGSHVTETISMAEMVIFYCALTNEYKVLKNRHGSTDNYCGKVETAEEKIMLLAYLMGTGWEISNG
jgi:hypothetical protein